LELLLNCEFDIDHKAQSIVMTFTTEVEKSLAVTRIDNVVDAFETDVAADEHSAEYIGAKNLQYKDPGYDAWTYLSCDWFIEDKEALGVDIVEFDTFAELFNAAKEKRTYSVPLSKLKHNNGIETLYYAKDMNLYFVHKIENKRISLLSLPAKLGATYTTRLIPVNMFGGRVVDTSDDADEQEIEFIPVRVDETDEEHGNAMFLSPSSYDETFDTEDDFDTDDDVDSQDMPFSQSHLYQTIGFGDLDEVEYYNSICVGFWDGSLSFPDKIAVPHVANLELYPNWEWTTSPYSLQLADADAIAHPLLTSINPKVKYTFSFLSNTIPNVRGKFNICGKLFICAKITTTFSENGMSKLMKGEFYPVND
jgi:hypothetical protein